MKASIQPTQILGKTASVLDVIGADVRLGHYARISYMLFDEQENALHSGTITMPSDDYAQWGSDDTYVINYIAQKLGLTVVSVLPIPQDPSPGA